MIKKVANEQFERIFEATLDDAVAYVAGMTGTFDIVEKVLIKTYAKLYRHLRKSKNLKNEDIEKAFLDILKDNTAKYINPQDNSNFRSFSKEKPLSPELILEEELEISESEFLSTKKNKKIHSYIMSFPEQERKIYILYLYCNYTAEKISYLLNTDVEYINNSIAILLTEIKEKFCKAPKRFNEIKVDFNL